MTAATMYVFLAILASAAASGPRRLQQVDVSIDPVAIGEAIAGAVKSGNNREAAVENAVNTAYYAEGNMGKYNVLCFNLQVAHEERLSGVQAYTSFDYDGITYGVWIFEDGSFTNNGDGGYINWRFMGSFTRDGNTVNFEKRS